MPPAAQAGPAPGRLREFTDRDHMPPFLPFETARVTTFV